MNNKYSAPVLICEEYTFDADVTASTPIEPTPVPFDPWNGNGGNNKQCFQDKWPSEGYVDSEGHGIVCN